jgi:shikimate dehydrogenase
VKVEINGKTEITGIFGFPVGHTLSPVMQNAAYESKGLNYRYLPFLVSPEKLGDAVRAIRALHIRGVNITIPHKEKVMQYLDEVHEEAAFIGAVNTVVNDAGRLTGYNTDGRGFMQSLAEQGIDVEDKDILINGAGGAARAVSYFLAKRAGRLAIFGRTPQRRDLLIHDLKKMSTHVGVADDLSSAGQFQMIINATPLGLKDDDPLPFEASRLKTGQVVCDLIYKKTRLLHEASRKGCVTLDGTGMLLWQGASAFQLWTGQQPDIAVMREALLRYSL